MVGNKWICCVATVMCCWRTASGQSQPGFAVNFVLPAGSRTVDGNTSNAAGPAIDQPLTIRYQQVYGASEFAYLTNFGGGWINAVIYFRGDATNGASLGIYEPNVRVSLSTTPRGPDQLSAMFAENVGADDTVVFSGFLVTSLVGHKWGGPPEGFLFEIPMSRMFFYNPAEGSLLLDVQVFNGNTNTIGGFPIVFDAVSVTNDSVSRVFGTVNATTGLVNTVGLPTSFYVWPNPKLNVVRQTNSVVLWWPSNPTSFVFQTSASIESSVFWKNVTNGVVFGSTTNKYTIPPPSVGAATFYRLMSTLP